MATKAFTSPKNKSLSLRTRLNARISYLINPRYWILKYTKSYNIIKKYFDEEFYCSSYPIVANASFDPIIHYLTDGYKQGYKPRKDFDTEFYLSKYADVKTANVNPFVHYIEFGRNEGRLPFDIRDLRDEYTVIEKEFDRNYYIQAYPETRDAGDHITNYLRHGWKAGRRPHRDFDPLFYESTYKDVQACGLNPFTHYILWGKAQGRLPCDNQNDGLASEDISSSFEVPYTESIENNLSIIYSAESGVSFREKALLLFDAAWYSAQFPSGDIPRNDAFAHYCSQGFREGRHPHPLFHTQFYLSQIPDLGSSLINPLEHYLREGASQGLSPHPLFDRQWYRAGNPDVAESGMDEFLHFVIAGDKEGRSPHQLFDPLFYLRNNPDVAKAGIGPLRHFLEKGGVEGRNPHPMFDCQYYCWLHPHIIEERGNPLVHYLMQERESRRHPHPLFDAHVQMRTSALAQETGIDPLVDYVQFRSSLDPALVARHATYIPFPARAILPARGKKKAPLRNGPLVSVLMPAYNSREDLLREAVNSVRAQTYENWEMIIVNDGSSESHVAPLIENIAGLDQRIQTVQLRENGGISRATNEALKLAAGEYVALIDHDDVLMHHAIEDMVKALVETDADAAYSDQAYVTAWGSFESTFYKPDWSPAFFSQVMYVGHLLIVRRSLALSAGGFDPGFDRLQDYEFMLRISERTKRIIHVPEILYRWRMIPGSIAHDANSKGVIEPLQAAAVNAHFDRTGFAAVAAPHKSLPHRLSIVPEPRDTYPAVSVLLRGDRPAEAIEKCLALFKQQKDIFERVDVIQMSPGSPAGASSMGTHDNKLALSQASPFVAGLRQALASSKGRYLLFMDPLADLIEDRWLDYLLLYAECSDVAFVAPHLYRRNGRVAAAGLVADEAGLLPAMQRFNLGEDGYAGSLACNREVMALPAGLLLADRVILEAIGGFDPDFSTPHYVFGDAAIRAVKQGYRNIALATPVAVVDDDYQLFEDAMAKDVILFRDLHAKTLKTGDPFYNINFQRGSGEYIV